jgi:hypothetical protein
MGGPALDAEDAVSLENVREMDAIGNLCSSPPRCGVDGLCVDL